MRSRAKRAVYLPQILVGGLLPVTIILGSVFQLPQAFVIIVVVILSIVFGSMALWAYANRHADGSEWWQDDQASGWRGY